MSPVCTVLSKHYGHFMINSAELELCRNNKLLHYIRIMIFNEHWLIQVSDCYRRCTMVTRAHSSVLAVI